MLTKQTIAAVFLLSLAVWVFFYVMTPEAPLSAPELGIVVAVCGALVLGVKRLAGRFQKRGVAPNEESGKAGGAVAGSDAPRG